ncbi:helix-turn-helix domain-containing protein [Bifidobacterium sp.]|uniref:helix-turn-helix domain-containing protein n=1 Tax=Bifidobacterium sp. TaxID=41200 RepID=UPI0039E89FC0
MGPVHSRISEEERQIIQIEVGNATTVRRIAVMLGRSASNVSREIKRNTWFALNQNESYRPSARPNGAPVCPAGHGA